MYIKKPKFNLEVLVNYTTDVKPPFCCNNCDYVTDKPSSLIMHWNRKHGSVTVPNELALVANDQLLTTQEQPKPPRKKWTRRNLPQEQPTLQAFRQVQFCPCCGTNIAAVNLALAGSSF